MYGHTQVHDDDEDGDDGDPRPYAAASYVASPYWHQVTMLCAPIRSWTPSSHLKLMEAPRYPFGTQEAS